jgi:hypothetical protein
VSLDKIEIVDKSSAEMLNSKSLQSLQHYCVSRQILKILEKIFSYDTEQENLGENLCTAESADKSEILEKSSAMMLNRKVLEKSLTIMLNRNLGESFGQIGLDKSQILKSWKIILSSKF